MSNHETHTNRLLGKLSRLGPYGETLDDETVDFKEPILATRNIQIRGR